MSAKADFLMEKGNNAENCVSLLLDLFSQYGEDSVNSDEGEFYKFLLSGASFRGRNRPGCHFALH